MFGFDFIRHLAVRSLTLVRPRSDLVDESKGYSYLENKDYLLSVGSYNGDITILKYNPFHKSISKVSTYHQSSFQPSWQTVHPTQKIIYSADEGNPGGLVSLRLDEKSGELKKIGKSEGINGTVSIAFYKNLAIVAAYTGHSIQTFDTTETGDISQARDTFTYFLEAPGPNKERQESSHPHQVVIDPTGHYVVAPDLGADLLRLYSVNGSRLSELQNIKVAAGSGPRHVAFHVIDKPNEIFERNRTMIYVVNELKNTLTVFKTRQWDNGTFVFHEVQNVPTLPPTSTENLASLPSPTAGEIVISKDKRFLYVSNRNDYSFKDKKFGSSDSIALYKIDPLTGFVSFVKLLQAGGVTPRHFSFDQSGKFVAVALQETDTIVIYKVDPTSGEFIDAEDHNISLHVSDRPVCVNWL
ncbi:hypothetical protein AOL_s00076g471 [Orbilia oligospora ATCC 24927]|uniref:6-phosphogluconolactonase n=1 Tax=Arthrobotrys oligospora (strain ATCC 24927 / CBS 115.81 / DSM 1491) TaxID=756982 RepID=G1XA13_ARTOA|nr:hypothetical protein AOL_s00076g471 [Orbilia oligospora ATCC 24927]EGX49985.1 hypothetical protein AOL_s00076g471 [Orbilia oligospora ATCC 24927]